jgi:hypothetical protein
MSLPQRRLGSRLALGGILLIWALTLMPTPEEAGRAAATPVYCILCGDTGSVDFLLNILLFIPLGLGLRLAGFSWRRTVLLTALLTCGIELLQMKAIAGRDASLGDILANTTGGGIGALIGAGWRRLVLPAEGQARRLAVAYALLLVGVWCGTAWALGPDFPREGRWFGASAPELGNFERFLGEPLVVTAGGEPLLTGPLYDQDQLTRALAADPVMAFRAVMAGPTSGLAPIGLIVDDREGDVLLIGQDGSDLAFELRMRATLLKLRNPRVSLHHGLAGAPGDTVEAQGALRNGVLELSSRNGGRVHIRRLPVSASWGWILVVPWDPILGNSARGLTALWIAGLLGILSYWSLRGGGITVGTLPVTTGILLGIVPWAAGFPPAHWSEWVAALLGTLVGLTGARFIRGSHAAVEDENPEAGPRPGPGT